MDWPELAGRLRPGEYAVVPGGMFGAFYARAVGLEVRDTVACVGPGGWEPILLLRRPSGVTVAECVLEHGVGGLDIDGCRVGSEVRTFTPGLNDNRNLNDDGWKGIGKEAHPTTVAGRWPTNLVFIHAPGCQRLGTKRVKGSHIPGPPKASEQRTAKWGFQDRPPQQVYTDEDGLETVESWQCVEGCPVKALDEMSLAAGVHGAGHVRNDVAGSDCGHDPKVVPFAGLCAAPRPMTRFGDSGGASRFFPQFADRQELLDWLGRLVGCP